MVVSKTFSGLNMNALKYLLPVWVSPLSGVALRCVFAAVAFWIIGMFVKPETSTRKEKIYLFLLGALGIYGFMFLYLVGLSKTTPSPVPFSPVSSPFGCLSSPLSSSKRKSVS